MNIRHRIWGFVILLCAISILAGNALSVPQDDRTRPRPNQQGRPVNQDDRTRQRGNARGNNANNPSGDDKQDDKKKTDVKAQPILDNDEEIPDSLLNTRWPIQRTTPITDDDLTQGSADLQRPENLQQNVVYNDTIDRYIFGNKIGGSYVGAPTMMTYDEYFKWSERQAMHQFFLSKTREFPHTIRKKSYFHRLQF